MALALLFAIAASVAALRDGPWLDEIWSFHLGDPQLSLREAVMQWLGDPHPLPVNLLYRVVLGVGADSPVAARLALNLPALILLVAATWLFATRAVRGKAFYPVLAALLLGHPRTIDHFADFRAYFVQLVLIGISLQYLHSLLTHETGERRESWSADALGLFATFSSLCLHFVTGLLLSAVYASALLWLAYRRQWPAVRRFGVAVVAAWLLMTVLGYVQMRQVSSALDVRWLNTTTAAALAIYAATAVKLLATNPVATAAAALSLVRPATAFGPTPWAYPAILTASMLASAVLLLAINYVNPIVYDRYLIAWIATGLAVIAALASHGLGRRPWLLLPFFAVTAAMILFQAIRAPRPGWTAGLDTVTALARQCSESRLLLTGNWRFEPEHASATARRESGVITDGQARMLRGEGLTSQSVGPAAPLSLPAAGRCPTILWVEHMYEARGLSPAAFLARGRIGMAPGDQARLIAHETGAVLVVANPSATR